MNNGSNSRLDRIEKIIETMVRAQRDRDEAMTKAQRERDEAQRRRDEAQRRRDEAMAKAQREREIEWEKRHLHHDREIRRIDARLSRFVKLGVAEARSHRRRMQALDATIKQLAAAQVVTEEKLQRFISSLSTNGFGRQT
jgi:hypothetical protein